MTYAASLVIQEVADVLQELASPYVRWKVDELVRWLNAGQRDIVVRRPDATLRAVVATLAAGTRQDLTALTLTPTTSVYKLIDITRNRLTPYKVVRQVARDMLDSVLPTWHNATSATQVSNFMYDPRDPAAFYVYPPASSITAPQLECIVSAYPTDIAIPASTGGYADVVGNIGVKDIYATSLMDYVLYRAYTKDAEFSGNIGRAAAHFTAYTDSLGAELKGTAQDTPTAPTTPQV